MKLIARFFVLVLCIAPYALWADAPLTGTAGSNLTAFSGTTASFNNNAWNSMIGTRTAPSADFGNCNALILRCAQPKCASGGCITMEIAYPIVSGCVMSNDSCKGHGDALIQTIAAQIVANSVARANEQAAAAQQDVTAQMTQQSEQQMQQMQMQMQQMQNQMAQQSAQQAATIQAALEEQKQLAAEAAAREAAAREEAARAQTNTNSTLPSVNVTESANMGVSADVLAREQASGQILTQLENAQVALKGLETTMRNAFEYAGCDRNGNNCSGPKRVKAFKQKAGEFFDPYETVLDEVYDALIYAQSLGVNLTDIYMMLNGSCNVWGKYMCQKCTSNSPDGAVCSDGFYEVSQTYDASAGVWRTDPRQRYCTLMQMLTSQDEVQQNWLDMAQGSSGGIRVACASDAIESSMLFKNRRKQSMISIETLERIIDQDAPNRIEKGKTAADLARFCAVDEDDVYKLQLLTQRKTLTSTGGGWGKVCVTDKQLVEKGVWGANLQAAQCRTEDDNQKLETAKKECDTRNPNDAQAAADCKTTAQKTEDKRIATCEEENNNKKKNCESFDSGGIWRTTSNSCDCPSETKELSDGKCVTLGSAKSTASTQNMSIDEQKRACSIYGTWNGITCNCKSGTKWDTSRGMCALVIQELKFGM